MLLKFKQYKLIHTFKSIKLYYQMKTTYNFRHVKITISDLEYRNLNSNRDSNPELRIFRRALYQHAYPGSRQV